MEKKNQQIFFLSTFSSQNEKTLLLNFRCKELPFIICHPDRHHEERKFFLKKLSNKKPTEMMSNKQE
jgi:hypothetical protein